MVWVIELNESDHNAALSDAISRTLHAYTSGHNRYMNDFVRQWKSASDLLHLKIYPDAKEITESYGALNAVFTRLKQYNRKDEDITLISVGDGRSPRTAALFAFRTAWKCISIDPQLNTEKIPYWEQSIQRLTCIPKRIEEVDISCERCIIVAVHSHADLRMTLRNITAPVRSMVAIPCCISYDYNMPPIEYYDSGIWSPKNLVKVWRDI